jgi:dipeptidyl aminopeptidase/acylaminoacyl peptidase
MKKTVFFLLTAAFAVSSAVAQEESGYRLPPKVLQDIAMAPLAPQVVFNDACTYMVQLNKRPFLSLEEQAQTEYRLGGARFNPDTYSISRTPAYDKATIVDANTLVETVVTGLPAHCVVWNAEWAPSNDRLIVLVKEKDGIYLYACGLDGVAKRLSNRKMNGTQGTRLHWINDTDFVFMAVPQGRGAAPALNNVPQTPIIQENLGTSSPARTYQDLLKNKNDEEQFEYYFTSQLVKITPQGETEIGAPGVYSQVSLSPDGSMVLLTQVEKPYSYTVTYRDFPTTVKIMDIYGKDVKTLAKNPVIVTAMGYDTTSPYPRYFTWRNDKPATVIWVEALDGGNPRGKKLDYLDAVYQLEAPFSGEKQLVVKTPKRFRGIQWCDDQFAIVSDASRQAHSTRMSSFVPCGDGKLTTIFEWKTEDNYANPGRIMTHKGQYGSPVIYTDKKHNMLMLNSEGASDDGDMPYVSRYDIAKKKNTILWRCQAPYYEQVIANKDIAKLQFITSRESNTRPANIYLRDLKKKSEKALTSFENPYKAMEGVTHEQIKYKRADGVDLTATVYLPAGYDKDRDGRLPVYMVGYPREYRSKADAAQVRGSKYTFPVMTYRFPAMFVTRGYCVMESVEMPIVGTETTEPNDNYIEQLVMDAEAAVKAIYDLGVGDTARIGVGGHSYGGFMTGNLMTHTKLFKAGIARSGAYNRTLTPFGFQSETRTYWEAPEVYNAMSPFMYADKLSGALLLIHGELDNNTGTFPIQSERFYQALKGHKATVRYVVLPLESHHYTAKENVLHLLYEQDAWLEKYVKNAK